MSKAGSSPQKNMSAVAHPLKMSSASDGWNINSAPRIDGRTVFVTGGASGLGARISKALSALGGQVTIADIDVKGAILVADEIRNSVDNARPEVLEIDLGDLRSVERAATTFRSRHGSLDLLVNNAGLMTPPYLRTVQGYESQWGIDHLGHFALTAALLDPLLEQEGSRVVVQTSCVHKGGKISFGDINSERSYRPWKAYKQSKLATLLFAASCIEGWTCGGSHRPFAWPATPDW